MGKFYTRKEGSLYIYITENDELIEPSAFPEELNLFTAESAWRMNNWMAICKEIKEENLDQAEGVLKMKGFSSKSLDEQVLDEYFRSGDEGLIKEEGLLSKLKGRLPNRSKGGKSPGSVIIPETVSLYRVEPQTVSKGEEEAAPPSREPQAVVQSPRDEAELIEYILAYIRSRGFTYPEWLLKDYYICLKTKPLVVLTGFSGVGKTALTRLMAEALTGGRDDRYLRVAIEPDWLDDRKLLGFYNPITERYISTPFLSFLLEASKVPEEPFFVCLDEMSLSRVEHYLSQFLSAMESMDRAIILHSIMKGVEAENGQLIPSRIRIPENLFVTGTIDLDESPYLSPKLLDCANLIEFPEVNLEKLYEEVIFEKRMALSMEALMRFKRKLKPETKERVVKSLLEISQIIKKQGFPVSIRVRGEILAYVANTQEVYSQDLEENLRLALDLQIKQRILTKIGGTETLLPTLDRLHGLLENRFPLSAEKVERMKERLNEDGFTSFYS